MPLQQLLEMKVIFVITLLIMLQVAVCQLLPQRLRIVDSNKERKTFLVRGNLPVHNKKFQMDELRGNLTQLTQLKRYRLVVVSFLNFLTAKETKNRYLEEKYFQKNKNVAEYRSRVVLGSLFDPTEMPNWTAKILGYAGDIIDFDELDELLEELHYQLNKGDKNTIVYIHCQAGVDRTGYVAGAYKMRYLGYSLKEVMRQNLDVLKGHRKYMIFNTQNGLQWYCFKLGRSQKNCVVESEL